MPSITAIEEAAQALASAVKGEGVLATARTALEDMKHAVETMLDREVEVIKRTSHSTGTERLSFVIGKLGFEKEAWTAAEKAAANAAVAKHAGEAKDVLTHLQSRGLTAEGKAINGHEPGFFLPVVDVVLDEKVLGYTPGQRTAALSARESVKPVSRLAPTSPAIEAAARELAAGKGEGAVDAAKTSLTGMKDALGVILGREPELTVRTSRSTGTRYLSVELGEGYSGAIYDRQGHLVTSEEIAAKSKQVCKYLESKGIPAKRHTIRTSNPGRVAHDQYVVDIPLDEKMLGFVPGENAASALGRGGTGKSIM